MKKKLKNNVTAVYFSPTYTSKKGCEKIAYELNNSYNSLDITKNMIAHNFSSEDIVVVGAPVYCGRLPKVCSARLRELHGNKTICIIEVTYGNRDYDDALLELSDIMTEQGFKVIAAAALIGEHTYGKIATGRPDDIDLNEDKAFADKIVEKILCNNFELPIFKGNRPYKALSNDKGFIPLTDLTLCSGCLWCCDNCPTGAISKQDISKIDDNKCISCFRCIKFCPTGAKNMDCEQYLTFAKDFSKKLSARRENEYFL